MPNVMYHWCNFGVKYGKFTAIVEKWEDGYLIGEVVELPGCHTQAKTMDALMERMNEAISLCLEVTTPTKAKLVGIQYVEV